MIAPSMAAAHAVARLSAGHARQRARPPGDRRLRRDRARARVRHAGLRRRRGRPAGPRARVPRRAGARATTTSRSCSRPRRSRARRCCGSSREEGLACDVASGGELHLALRAGFDPARIFCTATPSRAPELREALEPGVGHDRASTTSTSSTGSSAIAPARRAPGGAAARHARRRRRHAPRDLDRPGRLEVRLRARRRAATRSTRLQRRRLGSTAGLHFHIGSQLFELEPFRAAVEAIADARRLPGLQPRRRPRRSPTRPSSRPPSIEDYVDAMVDAAHELLGAGKRLLRRARAARWSPTRRDALHGRVGQAQRRRRWVARRRRHVATTCGRCSTARRYEADVADRARRAAASACHRRRQALRVRRRDRPRRAARRPAARRRRSSRRPPAPTATRWPTTTTASRARRWSSARTATRAWSCAARPTRTWSPVTSVAVPRRPARPRHGRRRRSTALLAERADAIERDRPGCGPSSSGVLTRSRGRLRRDPRAARDLIVELIGGHRPGARLRAARDAGRQARRHRQQAAALPARRGAVGGGARARRAAALRGRGRRRRAGHPRAPGVARGARTSSASTGSSTARRTSSSPRWRATGMTLRRGARPRRRQLGYAEADPTDDVTGKRRGGEDGDPRAARVPTRRCTSTRSATRASSTSPPTTSRTRSELGLGLKLIGTAERVGGGHQRPRAPGVPVRRASAGLGQRAVQRGHGRVRRDHRDHAVGPGRRRPADRERGARRRDQRDDPARLDAGDDRGARRSSATSRPRSTCTSRSPTGPACSPRSPRCSACRARRSSRSCSRGWATTRGS